MESNEVKRFKAMVRKTIADFEKLLFISFMIAFTANGFLTGFISKITQSDDMAQLYFVLSLLITIGGLFILFNEHDAEENQEEKETGR